MRANSCGFGVGGDQAGLHVIADEPAWVELNHWTAEAKIAFLRIPGVSVIRCRLSVFAPLGDCSGPGTPSSANQDRVQQGPSRPNALLCSSPLMCSLKRVSTFGALHSITRSRSSARSVASCRLAAKSSSKSIARRLDAGPARFMMNFRAFLASTHSLWRRHAVAHSRRATRGLSRRHGLLRGRDYRRPTVCFGHVFLAGRLYRTYFIRWKWIALAWPRFLMTFAQPGSAETSRAGPSNFWRIRSNSFPGQFTDPTDAYAMSDENLDRVAAGLLAALDYRRRHASAESRP